MVDLSDEMLMAYADDRLDPASRQIVEAAIRHRPEYRAKVEKFRQTLMPIRQAFGDAPTSEHLANLIRETRHWDLSSMDVAAGEPRRTRKGKARAGEDSLFRAWHWPVTIAASIAFLIGVGLGWVLQSEGVLTQQTQDVIAFGNRGLAAQGALRDLLEHVKSGATTVAHGGDQTWRLIASFTFRSVADEFCRRYEMVSGAGSRFSGYACRGGEGQWLIQVHVKSEASIHGKNGFVPSAGQSEAALDAAIDAVRSGDVLESAAENSLIENGWRNNQR